MSDTTDTPITDKCRQQMAEKGWTNNQPVWGLLFNMGDLERQLAEAREELENAQIRHGAVMLHTQSIVDAANKAIEQRDRLADALDEIRAMPTCQGCDPDLLTAVMVATQALASIERKDE